MAEKDDSFLDNDEEGMGDGKDAGKAGGSPKFASAFIMQILKWVLIILGATVFVITLVVITLKVMGVGETEKNDRIEPSQEYSTVAEVLSWYGNLGELRGGTKEDDKSRHTYIVQPQVGYADSDAAVQNELISKDIQIKDRLLTWFSSKSSAYLGDIDNREEIRETIKAEINNMLVLKIKDIRFTSYQILEF